MPFAGLGQGDSVVCPYDVSLEEAVECLACGKEMRVRKEHKRDGNTIPRVFVHDEKGNCEGETREHQKLKALGAHTLRERFPESTTKLEKQVPGTNRIADVILKFPIDSPKYGKGIIIEAQVKNKSKEIGRVTEEYHQAGYTVFWAYPSDVSETELRFTESRLKPVWPNAVPETEPSEYYHGYHAARHGNGTLNGTDEISIQLPPEYYKVHGPDIASARDDARWSQLTSIYLQFGGSTSWVNVLHESGQEFVLEWWRKDAGNRTEWLGNVPVQSRDDVRAIEELCESVPYIETNGDIPGPKTEAGWFDVASITVEGGELVGASLAYGYSYGEPVLKVTRTDPPGNARSMMIPWTADLEEGMDELVEGLFECFDRIGDQEVVQK